MSKSMFEQLMVRGNEASEGFDIEASVHIIESERVMIPGVNIQIEGMDSPLFISTEELRVLADEADVKIREWYEKQQG